jgi:hypothetical protein
MRGYGRLFAIAVPTFKQRFNNVEGFFAEAQCVGWVSDFFA